MINFTTSKTNALLNRVKTHRLIGASMLLAAAITSTTHAAPTYTITNLDPVGDIYVPNTTALEYTGAFPYLSLHLNESGTVAGITPRYDRPEGDRLFSHESWIYNPVDGTIVTGVATPTHSYHDPAGLAPSRRNNFIVGLNESGHTIGTASRYYQNPSFYAPGRFFQYAGTSAWYSDTTLPTPINPSGPGYDIPAGQRSPDPNDTDYVSSSVRFIKNDNTVYGGVSLHEPNSSDDYYFIGREAWKYEDGVRTPIVVTGPEYQSVDSHGNTRRSTVISHSHPDTNIVAGYAQAYADTTKLINQAFVYDGTNIHIIEPLSENHQFAEATHTERYIWAQGVNANGLVIGYARKYNSVGDVLGLDAWVYTSPGAQPILLPGLTGDEYQADVVTGGMYYRNTPEYITDGGIIAGITFRKGTPSLSFAGQDAWINDGNGVRMMGMTGEGYELANYTDDVAFRRSELVDLNEMGQAIGTSRRFFGPAAHDDYLNVGWFYDFENDLTHELIFSESDSGLAETKVDLLTEDGWVFGSYRKYIGDGDLGMHAYMWSLDEGFVDLGLQIEGFGESWQAHNFYFTDFNEAGQVVLTVQYQDAYWFTNFLLTPIPEPATLALFGLGFAMMIRRKH
ncbi:PEP-CTERM sorting domain-containing protein [Planctomycetota bacterium]|nr:PEP-CTERM sorting domain-containing protein [Planctomycetota bacterium]